MKLLKLGGEESAQHTLLTKVAQTLNDAGSGKEFGGHTHVFASPASEYSLEISESIKHMGDHTREPQPPGNKL